MDVPTSISGWSPFSNNAYKAPTCRAPREPQPLRTNASFLSILIAAFLLEERKYHPSTFHAGYCCSSPMCLHDQPLARILLPGWSYLPNNTRITAGNQLAGGSL